ncbi:hypothetical protein [Winogradskyella sp. SM1960]|uniref:hypothetical protein n=1 Tax=Winogradskyella sp. SM1960 TaxID=2865955 RepID=UPI001CD3763E|nr:hypothetical protein [Winogradskyella sp. SM1960]
MMKVKNNVLKVLFISLMFSFAACSSDDDNPNDDNGGTIGGNHTYDIELVGASETIELSASIPNPPQEGEEDVFNVSAVYGSNPDDGDGDDNMVISMSILNNTSSEMIYGLFNLGDNREALYPFAHPDDNSGDNETGLIIIPGGSSAIYESISGTLNFSNVKLSGTTIATGVTSFTLNFSGDFIDEDDNIYQGSGTIVISPLEGLNYN